MRCALTTAADVKSNSWQLRPRVWQREQCAAHIELPKVRTDKKITPTRQLVDLASQQTAVAEDITPQLISHAHLRSAACAAAAAGLGGPPPCDCHDDMPVEPLLFNAKAMARAACSTDAAG